MCTNLTFNCVLTYRYKHTHNITNPQTCRTYTFIRTYKTYTLITIHSINIHMCIFVCMYVSKCTQTHLYVHNTSITYNHVRTLIQKHTFVRIYSYKQILLSLILMFIKSISSIYFANSG